uniref:EF-hand domain-containing protein n=1 Tax=Emiliania huxleyi TaxID=2903 RepID=A0A7S3X201_EMIHU
MSDAGGGSTAYRLPVRDDEHSRLDRKRLWASLDPDRCGYLPARLLSDRLVQVLISKGVQSLAGKTPEAYRAQMLLGRAITGGKAAIALWRDGQPALLQHGAEEIGMGRLGPGTVEGGVEFARVLLCMDWFIRLDSMFKDLDNGDREVTREEFFGGKGVQFWDRLGRLMQAAGAAPLPAREAAFEEMDAINAGVRATDGAVTFDELSRWAMKRLLPPLSEDELREARETPLPEAFARLSAERRDELRRGEGKGGGGGGGAWVGPVGHMAASPSPRPPAARQAAMSSYIETSLDQQLGGGHNTAGYVTPPLGFGRYASRAPVFATEASASMTTYDGPGLQSAREGEWAWFKIVTRDSRMRATTLGEPEVQVSGPCEVEYRVVAYTESKARALGAKYGKGGPGMYIITWRPQVTPLPPPHLSSPPSPTALTASPPCTITAATPRPTPHSTPPAPQVEGDYVLKARLTSQADLPLFTKKISAKPPVTNGSLAAVRDAAVSQLRVVLPPEARRQVDREIGRRKQKLFRRSHEWRRADRRVRDAAREASAGAGDVESKVEAILADAERSAVTWRLRLSSSTGGHPEML